MDLNSDSCDVSPKVEPDSENSDNSNAEKEIWSKKDTRLNWTSLKTWKLIHMMENDCKELWDTKHPLNKDRNARQLKLEHLASIFGTTAEEISRKIHNLRSQFNNELRKIKKRQGSSINSSWGELSASCSSNGVSGWEYFDALSFLLRNPSGDPLDVTREGVNLALAEFQVTEEEFGAQAAAASTSATGNPKVRVATSSAPPPPISEQPLVWLDEPRLASTCTRVVTYADECKIFGDFVASELRLLHSKESRKKLKRIIQKAILQISDEEDKHLMMRK